MKIRLEDKTIIVVGAGTKGEGLGNGRAAAVQFAREGAKVLCVDLDDSAAEITANMIKNEGGQAEVCVADIVNSKDCERAVDSCLRHFEKLDVLHNNVGIPSWKEIVDTTEEAWNKIFNANIKGMFLMCKQAIPWMIEGGGGSIINVSSVASIRAFLDAAYVSSKGAVNSLTLYIAGRYGRYNIRANALLLGYIDTPLARPAWENEKVREFNLRQVPLRRFASPWEVAAVAAFLASDEASYVNGAILPVDGGLSLSM
jgi:NAD(P)-dependent dehydrogenase (short-subunit alcohol dehydrogenase family)